ncbi:hybrid-cluster NAD(P)-dependent oxidoreductase [Paraferrimonas sedimenticola]|uniref:Hybrid-cluster NAD(P)-dependent oxidoreductase n=1 Tax=Paraferrimonas sedimenticola TaxID=375674 RepID=A0AA37RVU5_9GAMM|nr:hybrid-cluster NAD(P)-dependent oxidoreductase [Paraferrimonas sedimenticola]GLP96665.1 hybrid-cluster NAD(P)-dependent oxidoreductase [Paraferrimonas sedimenticola]
MTDMSLPKRVCRKRVAQTADTVTFEFDRQGMDYLPGQFVLLEAEVNGQALQRAYSLSSSPSQTDVLALTIKRVEGGQMSNHLIDKLQPGMAIGMSHATGEFSLNADTQAPNYLLISAGSGVTPVMSMARELVSQGSTAPIRFVHFARSVEDWIFASEIQALAEQHSNLQLELVLSEVADPAHHFGLLNQALFDALIDDLADTAVFTCGPEPFMAILEDCLATRGFDMARFYKESFTPVVADTLSQDASSQIQVSAPAFGKATELAKNASVLEAAEDMQLPIIAACRSGICGSCKCKVTEGEFTRTSQTGLSEQELAEGYVLACSSTLQSDAVIELG